jgi:hypothetical protein
LSQDKNTLGAGGVSGDNISVAPFFQFDVFYDYVKGTVGLEPKQ